MTLFFVGASILSLIQFHPTVRIIPEISTIKQGDPLLLRADLKFGIGPEYFYLYPYIKLSPSSSELEVSVRRPDGVDYQVVRTTNHHTANVERWIPAAETKGEPPGKSDAGFVWVVRDRDEPVFSEPGNYLLRARVRLQDRTGAVREVYSEPVVIKVEPTPPALAKAITGVQPDLYYALAKPGYFVSPQRAEVLRDARGLEGSSAASAVRRVLALSSLQRSKPGESRRAALAECERVRAALPPVGVPAFDIEYADALLVAKEYARGRKVIERIPEGPRRLSVRIDYMQETPRK